MIIRNVLTHYSLKIQGINLEETSRPQSASSYSSWSKSVESTAPQRVATFNLLP